MADAAPRTTGSRIPAATIKDGNVYNLAGERLEIVDDVGSRGNSGRAKTAMSFLDMAEGPIRYPRTLPKSGGIKGG